MLAHHTPGLNGFTPTNRPRAFSDDRTMRARNSSTRPRALAEFRGFGRESPGSIAFFLASRGSGLDQNRPWPGLVDFGRAPSGTVVLFFREVHPASEMGCKHRQNRLHPGVSDLASKAQKAFFTKFFGVIERTCLYISAPRASMRTLLQSYSANKQREPRRSVFPVP